MQQKLKSSTFEKIMKAGLTSAELNFIVYLSHFQKDDGTIVGVYYKDICEAIGISYQTFYDVLKNLSGKGIIAYKKKNYDDWDITILDNDFTYDTAVNEGYISMGHDIFSDEEFFTLKVQEKLLAMHIMRASGAGTRRYCINIENFYEKFTRLLGVSRRVLRGYIKRLRSFFSIGIKDNKIWITLLKKSMKNVSKTDKEAFSWHIAKVLFRRSRAEENEKSLNDTANLIKQYAGDYKDRISDYMAEAVSKSLKFRNAGIKSEYKWNREISPRYVHYLLKEVLA